MKQENELWMKKMKEMLDNYSEPLPAGGWEKLEKELTPRKRLYLFKEWRAVAAAVLLLAVLGSSLLFLNTDTAEEIQHTSVPVLASVPDDMPVQPETDPTVTTNEAGRLKPVAQLTEHRTPKQEQNLNEKIELKEAFIGVELVPQEPIEEEETVAQQQESAKSDVEERKMARPSSRDKLHLPVEKRSASSDKKGWSVGVNVNSSALSSSGTNGGGNGELVLHGLSNQFASTDIIDIPSDLFLVMGEGMPYLAARKEVEDIKHRQPITVGLSVRKGITRSISLESGVTYTLLSSDVTIAGNAENKVDQDLHYIGIPLRANWNMVDTKKFTLYLSAGGAVEKCVYGKLGSEKKTVDPLQFSLLGAVGAQLNLSNRVGLYVEPGVSYYFDDGSSTETIRKDKPFNINLQAGIRFTY
ncbi:PorT family protein [Bacteroides sp. OttesenSCG-928-M17]|nr:PorT family protein [Bacteroides sp. OttesenSCG-928-M17]MDL2291852.1 PorT family protein [Bacteroides sp. OttesenSCG-928-F21]